MLSFSQIVFTILENTILYAIDEDNQHAAMFNDADRGFVFEMLNEMIHSTNSSESEDYWYSNKTCKTTDQYTYPCEEIYFISRKIDEKYFNNFSKNWSIACQDASLV